MPMTHHPRPRILGSAPLRVALLLVVLGTASARADRYEAQWSARPLAGLAMLKEEGASGGTRTLAGGLSVGVEYGLSNSFDLGVELVTLMTATTALPKTPVLLDGGREERSSLSRRASSTMLLVGPTWRFGVSWIPVVSVAAGGGMRVRSAGRFNDLGFSPSEKAATMALDLGGSASVGIERRVNRRMTVGGYVSALASWSPSAPVLPAATVSIGISYVNYPRW
jgi:hypothetical protein